MIARVFFLTVWLVCSGYLYAQIAAGPMLGPVELRSANIWIGMQDPSNEAILKINHVGDRNTRILQPVTFSKFEFHAGVFTIGGLEPNTQYEYTISVKGADKKISEKKGVFTTKSLFQWRTAAPDFTFLAGSCAYFNEPRFDRPGRAYGMDTSIFETMAREKAAFMLWLGDNWYTREVDYQSEWGLWYRAWHDRSQPILQNFWASMPHLAIWDDHDYGPNDYGKSYHLKNSSREIFSKLWLNPSYGDGTNGIYTRYQHNDVDFFMLDDRWWRDFDKLPDSVNGVPNADKRMLGKQQMDWLKQELLYSQTNPFISFRMITIGSQVLNPVSPFDKLLDFPVEYYELINFIKEQQIEGVIFLNGDRHHSEVIRVQHSGLYPLYDITSSPVSSGTHTFGAAEANNPYRVFGLDKYQNYARISIAGEKGKRVLQVEFVGVKGDVLGKWAVQEGELKMPGK